MRGHTTILFCDNDLNLLTRLWPYMNILKIMCVSEIYCEKSNKDFLFVGAWKRRSEEKECLKEEKQHTKSTAKR